MGLASTSPSALLALLDIDRFKAIHASLGDAGGDPFSRMLAGTARRTGARRRRFSASAATAFALLFAEPRRAAQALGDAWLEFAPRPHLDGREIFAPASVGTCHRRESGEPLALIKNAELALIAAKRQRRRLRPGLSVRAGKPAPADAWRWKPICARRLDDGQIDVYYQPIMRLADRARGGLRGAAALAASRRAWSRRPISSPIPRRPA